MVTKKKATSQSTKTPRVTKKSTATNNTMSDKVHSYNPATVADPLTQPMTQNSETDNSEIMKDQIMGDTYDIDFSDVSSYYTLDKKGTPKKVILPLCHRLVQLFLHQLPSGLLRFSVQRVYLPVITPGTRELSRKTDLFATRL